MLVITFTHTFKGLVQTGLRSEPGFGKEILRLGGGFRYLVVMVTVRVRGQELHYVNACPHKYRSTLLCVCVCVSQLEKRNLLQRLSMTDSCWTRYLHTPEFSHLYPQLQQHAVCHCHSLQSSIGLYSEIICKTKQHDQLVSY